MVAVLKQILLDIEECLPRWAMLTAVLVLFIYRFVS